MNTYLVSYDSLSVSIFEKQFISFLSESRTIHSWSKAYDGMVLIQSMSAKHELYLVLKEFFGKGVQFFVVEITSDNSVAMLAPNIWTWFNDGLPYDPISPSGL